MAIQVFGSGHYIMNKMYTHLEYLEDLVYGENIGIVVYKTHEIRYKRGVLRPGVCPVIEDPGSGRHFRDVWAVSLFAVFPGLEFRRRDPDEAPFSLSDRSQEL